MEEWLVRSLAREYASYWSRCVACEHRTHEEDRHEFSRMSEERVRVCSVVCEGNNDQVRAWFFDEAEKAYSRYAWSRRSE
jgi:hypothetical protein